MWLATINPDQVRNLPHGGGRLQHLGQRIRITLFGTPVMRCGVCHAELTPDEFGDRACSDRTACCLRRFSQRCL